MAHESNKKNKPSHYRTDTTLDTPAKEELKPIVKFVVDSWDKWEAHWADKMTKFEDYYERWMGRPPTRDQEWQSNFNKRLSWQAEKALVARFHSALFPTAAPIEYDTTEVKDELTGILGRSLVAHWFKIGSISLEFLKAMRSASIYGSGLFEDGWFVRTELVHEKKFQDVDDFRPMVDKDKKPIQDEEGNVQVVKVGTKQVLKAVSKWGVVEDRYRVQKANIFAWKIHPHKLSDEDDLPSIKQEFVTYEDLITMQRDLQKYGIEKFENLDKVKEDTFKINEGDLKKHKKDGEFKDEKNPTIEILHFFGHYADGDKEKKPMWIMIANRKYKLQGIENPFWHKKSPLMHINWTDDEKNSYYGIGICEIGKDAEDRANTTVNIRIDERKKNIKGGGWYNALDKKIKKTEVQKNVPGLWKRCSDVNAASRPDIPIPSTPDDYKEEEIAVNDHREITGATTALLPSADSDQQHDTLGGMKILAGQSLARLKPDLAMMEIMGIKKIANRSFLLSRQFYSRTETIKLVATTDEKKRLQVDKIHELQPGEIMAAIHFHSTGLSESIEKAQNIDKLLKYAEVTGKIPGMQEITNYQGIAKRIALWLGFEDVEDFVLMNPEDPLDPIKQLTQQIQGNQPQPGQQQPQRAQGGGLPPEQIKQIAQSVGR